MFSSHNRKSIQPKPQPPACFPFLFNYEPTEQLQPFEPLGSPLDPLSFRPQPLVQSPSLPPGYLATPPPITIVAGHHTPSSPLLKNDCHTSSPPHLLQRTAPTRRPTSQNCRCIEAPLSATPPRPPSLPRLVL
jgi:hypothetical protein